MPHFPTQTSESTSQKRQHASRTQEAEQARIRIRNRRKTYLDRHEREYFTGANLELADPLLYDQLIRRWQTPAEREKEGRERGYTGSLEADLVRAEAKLEALQHPDPNSPMIYQRAADGSIIGVEADQADRAQSKEEGRSRWLDVMRQRFLNGQDDDFDYATVDDNDEYDDHVEEDREQLEDYLATQSEEFLGDGEPTGQTGIQDF